MIPYQKRGPDQNGGQNGGRVEVASEERFNFGVRMNFWASGCLVRVVITFLFTQTHSASYGYLLSGGKKGGLHLGDGLGL